MTKLMNVLTKQLSLENTLLEETDIWNGICFIIAWLQAFFLMNGKKASLP